MLNENVVRSGNLTNEFEIKSIEDFKGSSLGYNEYTSSNNALSSFDFSEL